MPINEPLKEAVLNNEAVFKYVLLKYSSSVIFKLYEPKFSINSPFESSTIVSANLFTKTIFQVSHTNIEEEAKM